MRYFLHPHITNGHAGFGDDEPILTGPLRPFASATKKQS